MESPTMNPYTELVRNVPEPLKNCIKRAADAEAALAWLRGKKPPDPESASGLNSNRRHLKKIGEDAKLRWIVWGDEESNDDDDDNESDAAKTERIWTETRYDNDDEEIEKFADDTVITVGPEGWNAETEDRLPFRHSGVTFLTVPEGSKDQDFDIDIPAGTYYVVSGIRERHAAYHGLYRLERHLRTTDEIKPNPSHRIWLNGAAERLLARALTT